MAVDDTCQAADVDHLLGGIVKDLISFNTQIQDRRGVVQRTKQTHRQIIRLGQINAESRDLVPVAVDIALEGIGIGQARAAVFRVTDGLPIGICRQVNVVGQNVIPREIVTDIEEFFGGRDGGGGVEGDVGAPIAVVDLDANPHRARLCHRQNAIGDGGAARIIHQLINIFPARISRRGIDLKLNLKGITYVDHLVFIHDLKAGNMSGVDVDGDILGKDG